MILSFFTNKAKSADPANDANANANDNANLLNDPNNKKEGNRVRVLIVQLFSPETQIIFYKRSHLHQLRAKKAKIGTLNVVPESLEVEGIEPLSVEMKEGGL